MAEKNWLIRTKNNQILGPATKQKVIELIEKGSLGDEDEICCGNGYWIWIKEKELLDKYIYGDVQQEFNPISEAPDVLTAGGRNMAIEPFLPTHTQIKREEKEIASSTDKEEAILPDREELEYPDIELISNMVSSESEDFGELEVDDLESDNFDIDTFDISASSEQFKDMKLEVAGVPREETEEELLPSDSDLQYPKMSFDSLAPEDISGELPLGINKSSSNKIGSSEKVGSASPLPRDSKFTVDESENDFSRLDEEDDIEASLIQSKPRNDKYLFFILILVFFLIAVLYYYYRMVLNRPLPLIGISSVHAQSISSISKKKTFLN